MNDNHVFGLTAMDEHPIRKQHSDNQSHNKALVAKLPLKEPQDSLAKGPNSKRDLKMPLVSKTKPTQQNFFEATR